MSDTDFEVKKGSGLKYVGIGCLAVFLAPLSKAELLELREPDRNVALPAFVADVMRRKLLRRTTKQKGILSLGDLENIERRCTSAYREMQEACHFDAVIVTHDGEDSENWSDFYHPLADARMALLAFVELLEGRTPDGVERWQPDLLP